LRIRRNHLAVIEVDRGMKRLRGRAADQQRDEHHERELHAAQDRPNEQAARIPGVLNRGEQPRDEC
jgi:hypothetical protein